MECDKKISWAIHFPLLVLSFQHLILNYFNLIGSEVGASIQFTSMFITGVVFIYALPCVLKINFYKSILIYLISIAVFLINIIIFTNNIEYIFQVSFDYFLICLPVFIYALSINNMQIFYEQMKKISLIVLAINSITFLLEVQGFFSLGAYSMAMSYYLLLPAIIYLNESFNDFEPKYFIGFLLSLMIIILSGARGPLLSTLLFIFYKFFAGFRSKMSFTRGIINILLSFFFLSIPIIYYSDLIDILYRKLNKIGIESRSLRVLVNRGFLYFGGREWFFENTIRSIRENPILGVGIAGTRNILDGSYPHNIFLELFADFGIIFGAIIIILLFCIIVKSMLFLNSKHREIIWMSLPL